METLFNYKGVDIQLEDFNGKWKICLVFVSGMVLWLEQGTYNNRETAITSGREYARIVIDELIINNKKDVQKSSYRQHNRHRQTRSNYYNKNSK